MLITAAPPSTELEQLLVDRITSCAWRLRRVVQVEAGLFVWRLNYAIANKPKPLGTADEELRALQESIQGTPRVVDDDRHSPAVRQGQEANGLRNEALGTLGRAFSTDAGGSNAFSKLARYESNIERALFRALQELQRLQSARLGNGHDADVAPPAAPSGSDGVAARTRQAAPVLSAGDSQSASGE